MFVTGKRIMSKNGESLEVLKNLLGENLFQVTMDTFAGQRIIFPKNPDSFDRDSRNMKILSDFERNVPVARIASRNNLTTSQVYKIIEKVSE